MIRPPDSAVFDVSELIAALWRRRWWVILPVLLAGSLAATYGLARPEKYVATAQILIDPRGLQVTDGGLTPPVLTSEALAAIVESQMRVMVSDPVLSAVVRREGLASDPEFTRLPADIISRLRAWLAELFTSRRRKRDPARTALETLSKGVGATRPKAADVINLFVSTRDPEKSARLANAITDVYADLEFKRRGKLAERASSSMTKRLGQLRTSVQAAESAVEAYGKKKDFVGSNGRLVSEQQLTQLNGQLIAQQGIVAKARARYDQIRRLRRSRALPDSLAGVANSQTLRQLQGRLAAVLGQQAILESQFFPAHPRLRQARARTQGLRRLIALELNRLSATAKLDFERAQADEKNLQRRRKQLAAVVLNSSQAQVELRELERKAQAARVVYEAFLVRVRELSGRKALDISVTRVLSPAVASASESGPRLALLLAAGLIGGFGFGALLALLRDQMDSRIFSAKRLRRETGLSVIAEMPRLAALVSAVADVLRERSGKGSLSAGKNGEEVTGPDGRIARALGAGIGSGASTILNRLAARSAGGGSRTVLLCSASSGNEDHLDASEGASSLALALALRAANDGYRVVLVDGDRRARRLSEIAGRSGSAGLVEVINGDLDGADVIQPVPELGLWMMPAGKLTGMPRGTPPGSAMGRPPLSAPSTAHGLSATSSYDWIIIDGGNLDNAAQRLLVPGADDILLVVHRGSSASNDIDQAAALLQQKWNNLRGHVMIENEPKVSVTSADLSVAVPAFRGTAGLRKAFTPGADINRPPPATSETSMQQRSGSAASAYKAMAAVRDGREAGGEPGNGPDSGPDSSGVRDDIAPKRREPASPPRSQKKLAALGNIFEVAELASDTPSFGDMMQALQNGAGDSAARAFRGAIARLLKSVRNRAQRNEPQIVMMVAGHDDAGTSASALSLAYAASLSGLRCLLVDANSKDPALSAVFSASIQQDRPCVLDSRADLAALISKDSGSGLQLLPIALADLNSLSSLQRRKFCAGLSKLADDFDLVVVDGGNILADDAAVDLAACADQLLIVARRGLTLPGTIEATSMALEQSGELIAGVVLTRSP